MSHLFAVRDTMTRKRKKKNVLLIKQMYSSGFILTGRQQYKLHRILEFKPTIFGRSKQVAQVFVFNSIRKMNIFAYCTLRVLCNTVNKGGCEVVRVVKLYDTNNPRAPDYDIAMGHGESFRLVRLTLILGTTIKNVI